MVLFVNKIYIDTKQNICIIYSIFFSIAMAVKIVRDNGILALYNGLSASCLRQATYTTTRFGIYGAVKSLRTDSNLHFIEKISLAAAAGAVGAFVG
jgi:hypothetical protein